MPFRRVKDIIRNMKIFELKHKKIGFFKGIMIVLVILAGLFALSFILYLLNQFLHFAYMFWVEFVLVIALAVYVARTKLIEFTYYLDGDILRVDRIASARPKLDLFTRMDKIIFAGKLKNLPEAHKKYKYQRETFKRITGDAFCVVYLNEKKYFTAILTPSGAFESAVVTAWKAHTYKPKKKK